MATKELVTTNFSVNFSIAGDAKGLLKAEVDNRDVSVGGLNASTNFKPGDDVEWLLFKSKDVVVSEIISSHGSNTYKEEVSYLVEDYLTVSGDTSVSLPYPFASDWSAEWIGDGGIKATIDAPAEGASAVTFSGSDANFKKYGAIGVLKVSYLSTASHYTLAHTPIAGIPEYSIVVFVAGTNNN